MYYDNVGAIYYMLKGDDVIAQRIDSIMIEPMHNLGYTIIKILLDGNNTEERLHPEDKIPDGFIVKSEYGEKIFIPQERRE